MSRKSRRNTSKNAAMAERISAIRLNSSLGLSSLALGSMAIAGALHAQDASPTKAVGANAGKAKAVPSRAQAKSLRTRATRLAANGALPANGAGLYAQNSANAANGAAAQSASVLPPTTGANTLQEIVVTGIRGSLQRALEIKKMSIGVVDAISAEDIGQFPDASIGQALGRIPGITVDRGGVNQSTAAGAQTATGNPSGITIRGFGTQFNEILTEGRQIASGNGQNFDFAALGANYVGEVDVHKTPDFSLSGGAIGGTINVKFPNPFDNPGFHSQAFFSENDNPNDGGMRPAFGALVSDTFDHGRFGVLLDGDYTDTHSLAHHLDTVGWEAEKFNCSQYASAPSGCPAGGANPNYSWYPQDQAMYLDRTDSRRKDGRVAVQWHPTENVLVTVDDNYSSDDEHTDRWQFSTWFSNTGLSNITQDSNGTITNFTTGPNPTDFNAFVADTYITTNTPGLNVQWDVNDHWTAELDADQSVSKLNPNGTYSDVDADTGYGPNTSLGTNGYTGGLVVNQSNNVVPYWSALGPNNNAANFNGMNPYLIGSHVVPIQTQENSDRINEAKLDATWHRHSTRVNFGFQFLDDTWNSKELDTFTNNEWQLWSGYGPASNNYVYYCGGGYSTQCASQTNPPAGATQVLHGVSLPQGLFTPISLTNFIPGMSGNGNLPPGLNLYSPYAVLNYLITQPINADWTPNAGYPQYTGGYPTPVISTSSVQHVDRSNYAPYVTAEHNFHVGGLPLKADVGLRYEKTDVTVAGLAAPLLGLGLEPGDKTAYSFQYGSSTWTQVTNSYHYLLPSLDLNLMVRPDLKLRADFSRTESPTPNVDLIPNTSYNGRVGSLTATGNNPYLLPYLSNNFDLGAEWYYGSNSYAAVDGFMKRVSQFPTSTTTILTIPGVMATSPLDPNYGGLAQFKESTNTNSETATVTGVEVTWQQMLPLGFGVEINGTYAHSNKNFNPYQTQNQFALPGVGNSANLIAFYQRHGFQARVDVQWEGKYLLGLGQEQPTGAFGGNEPVYLLSSTEVDFSTSYQFTHYLQGYFEALNLTNQEYRTVGRFSNQQLNTIDYGTSLTAGVRLKF
jgi:iron complex outermembrane receptor protein